MRELSEQEYERLKAPIRALQTLRGSRPFTDTEMALLTKTARNCSEDFRLRVRALSALWHAKDPHQKDIAIGVARDLLRDNHPTVRAYAAHALGVLNDSRWRSELQAVAQSDSDLTVRQVAARALARLR